MSSRFRVSIGALLLIAASCVTPSVPIPPPAPEKMAFDLDVDAGTASFSFDPDPTYSLAVVYIFNRDKGVGVIDTAQSDGSVNPTQPFEGEDGDEVVITFETDTQLASTCVRMAQGQSSSAFECIP